MDPSALNLTYDFSPEEVLVLAKIFRKHGASWPGSLLKFGQALEQAVYSGLTLEEVQEFYEG